MIIIQPSSPYWPLAVAQLLGQKKAPGIYSLKYQDWILWHSAFLVRGAGFKPDSPIEELS